jgi:hypothetical protein
MKRPKREHLRPIKNAALADKRFTPVLRVKKRVNLEPSRMVITDLRRGSIGSLDRYLFKTKGVMNREVALELRKLISGTIKRTKFRLIVVEHPNKPKDKGGRPEKLTRKPSAKAFAVADEFGALRQHGQVKAAVADLAKKHGIRTTTIYKYKLLFGPAELRWDRREQHELESDKQQALPMRVEAARKTSKDREKKNE